MIDLEELEADCIIDVANEVKNSVAPGTVLKLILRIRELERTLLPLCYDTRLNYHEQMKIREVVCHEI